MKIVTIGTNPYYINSFGKLHSKIIKNLYLSGNEVAVLSHNYDTSYFVPEESNDFVRYCYKFEDNDNEYAVPVFPYSKQKNQEETMQIYDVLEKLKPDYKEVLILKFFEDKDYQEISDILQKPMGTVATLLSRAKIQFKEVYEKENKYQR